MKKSIYFILLLVPMLLQGMEHSHDNSVQTYHNQQEETLKSLLDFRILPENLNIQNNLTQLTLKWHNSDEQISIEINAADSPTLTVELNKKSICRIKRYKQSELNKPAYNALYKEAINKKINFFISEKIKNVLEQKLIKDKSTLKFNSTIKELELLFNLYTYKKQWRKKIAFDTLYEIIFERKGNLVALEQWGYL